MLTDRKPFQLANEVRLKRSQFPGAFLLLEGPDDSRFYRRFVDLNRCHLVVCFNKQNVISAVKILEADGLSGVLGIVDQDFDGLDNKKPDCQGLVTSDCHDLESTLIRSSSFEAVLHEHASDEKLKKFEDNYGGPLRDWLLASARPLGYLRWNSIRMGLNLAFEGIRFSHFVDSHSLVLDPSSLRNEIRNHSQAWTVSEQ
jgi:hypothetical protein